MGRGLIFLVGAALAQQSRPLARLGERLGLRADTPRPKNLEEVLAVVQQLVHPSAASDTVPTPTVCAADEIMCTETLQGQGMNCVVGACVKLPDTRRAALGSKDANGCQKGGGYSWCATKSKCLRAWEEPCEEAPVAPTRPGFGGARDANGCLRGAGYNWCESKKKCLRRWEEPCEEVPAPVAEVAPLGATKDEHNCVLGGGYQWCENKQKCLRSWEEPCEEQEQEDVSPRTMLRNMVLKHLTPEQKAQMDNVMGEMKAKQAHFRETMQQKMAEFKDRMGVQDTPRSEEPALGASSDEHGCVLGGGYQWCEHKQKCVRSWEEPCEVEEVRAPAGAAKDEHGCTLGGGFQWCENKQKCLRQWEEPCEEQTERPIESALLEIVSKHLTPEQKVKMDNVVSEMKAKQARFRETMQQKIAEFKDKKMGGEFEASLRARLRSRVNGRFARIQEKIGAHEDNRVPVLEAVKEDAVVDSVI